MSWREKLKSLCFIMNEKSNWWRLKSHNCTKPTFRPSGQSCKTQWLLTTGRLIIWGCCLEMWRKNSRDKSTWNWNWEGSMTTDSTSSRSSTSENINNSRISSCFMRSKSRIKPPKYQWPKSNTHKLYSQRLSILKRWSLKGGCSNFKLPTRTDKYKLWTLEYKKCQVSKNEKYPNSKNKFKTLRMIIKGGWNNKTEKPNLGMRNEPISRKRYINFTW